MRKLIVNEFLTLDGVMQAPGGADEDRTGGFEHGGWQMSHPDDIVGETVTEAINGSGGMLLGRRTYGIFAGYWPTAPEEERGIADPMNAMPKYVASRTLREPLEWNNSTLISGDLAAGVRDLKQQPGQVLNVIGSGNLVQSLIASDLVDEFRLMIYPIVLGSGQRLFRDGVPRRPLELIDSKVTTTGVLIASYRPA